MFRRKQAWFVLLAIFSLVISACAPATTATATQPAATAIATTEPAMSEPTQTATTAPSTKGTKSKDPTTFVLATFGDPETLDPHLDYESAGQGVLENIYENLVTFDGRDPSKFKPLLVESIPDPVKLDNGGVQYVWKILDGVKFHNGDSLTAGDVAYSFWRSMLEGDNASAANYLLLEAFFNIDDPTQLVDTTGKLISDPDGLKASTAAKLQAACQQVKDAVTFDDASRTVTMTLVHPWGPFIASLGGGAWAAVVDQKWVADQGDWNGDCQTWQNFYSIPSESGVIRDKTNGTGPYMLDHWIPNQELVMTANPNYRGGEATLKHIVIKIVNEFGTRFAMQQAGDADSIALGSKADEIQMDTLVRDQCDNTTGDCKTVNPDGILRAYRGLPATARTDVLFNFNVAASSGLVGSGKLDGEGIPLDFFSDAHIRHAFNYCFDWDTYIKDVLLNEGVQSLAITLPGQPGYDGSPVYSYDLQKCADEFKASTLTSADGKSLWDTGFYLQLAYNVGNTGRQSIAQILAAGIQQVNTNFLIVPVALPWPTFLRAQRNKELPIMSVGWAEDIHDPHNWYVPFLEGTYAARQSLPDTMKAKYVDLINQGVLETDFAKRAAIYSQLNQLVHDDAPTIILASATYNYYEPLYMKGWFNSINMNPLPSSVYVNFYYYTLSKD